MMALLLFLENIEGPGYMLIFMLQASQAIPSVTYEFVGIKYLQASNYLESCLVIFE